MPDFLPPRVPVPPGDDPEADAESPDTGEAPAPEGSAAPDPVSEARERIERALGDDGPGRGASHERGPRRTPASGRRAAATARTGEEHWSETIRQRVSDAAGGDEPSETPETEAQAATEEQSAAETETEQAPVEPAPAEAPPTDEAASVRERVERRLKEAEERRTAVRDNFHDQPTPAPPPTLITREKPPATPAATSSPDTDDPTSWGHEAEEEWQSEAPASVPQGRPLAPRIAEFIATCGGLGRLRVAPGTFGAIAGLGAYFVTRGLPGSVQLVLLVVATLVGTWAAGRYARDRDEKDPQSAVVDEFCGMWLALVAASPSLAVVFAVFVAFRVLDIFKPPPIRQAERLPGGIGIMADDLVAGGVVRILLFIAVGL